MPLAPADALYADFDVCVVGAGPAGLACAIACQEAGLRTLVVEAGGLRPVSGKPDVVSADIVHPDHHDPVNIVCASALGGTSNWWSGRCMSLNPADFGAWPIKHADLERYWAKAASFLGAPEPIVRNAPPVLAALKHFDASAWEAWGPELNMARRWRSSIQSPGGPVIVLGARVISLDVEDGVAKVRVRRGDREVAVAARQIVLAAGGLGVQRLLLLAQRHQPSLFGGVDGPLGRGYMGHLAGEIADLHGVSEETVRSFHRVAGASGGFTRRRIVPREQSLRDNGLLNIGFWLDNPGADDPSHGSAASSAKYLAARALSRLSGGTPADRIPLAPHFARMSKAPFAAARGLGRAAAGLASARLLGRHLESKGIAPTNEGGWRLFYHAEQASDPQNRVTLAQSVDSLGLPRLKIDMSFRDRDFESVIKAHELLDADLRSAGSGSVRAIVPKDMMKDRIRAQARDGYHQLGGASMSADPSKGVVDADCRVHGVSNLSIASSAVFASGGQANPTMTIVALSLRIAERLCRASQ